MRAMVKKKEKVQAVVDVRFPSFDVDVTFRTVDFKLGDPSSESELGWNMDVSLNAGQLVQQSRNVPGSHHDLELLLTWDRQINVAVSLDSLRQIPL